MNFEASSFQTVQMTNLEHTEILYNALASEYGIVVETDDAERLRQKLYAIKRECEDFAPLSFIISPFNGVDLWIVKKGTVNGEG